MKFLSRLGQIALKVGQVVGIFGPIVQTMVPSSGAIVGRIMDTSQQFSSIIMQVELGAQALNIPGADKLKMAVPVFAQAILQSAAIGGKKVANETLFMQGVKKVAGGWADILNSLHEEEVEKLVVST